MTDESLDRKKEFIKERIKVKQDGFSLLRKVMLTKKQYRTSDVIMNPSLLDLYASKLSVESDAVIISALFTEGEGRVKAVQEFMRKYFFAGIIFAKENPECLELVKETKDDTAFLDDVENQEIKRMKEELEST